MEISEFTLKLIILLIPGGISCLIFEKLTIHKSWNSFKFISNSIFLGGLSYLSAQLIFGICNDLSFANFWENLPTKQIPFKAVIKSSFVAILIGFAGSKFDHYKILNRIGKKLKVTTKYGDEDLFYYFLNSSNVTEVYVRDIKNNITYHGLVDSFSENGSIKEIVLSDVKIYNYETSEFAYSLSKIYLCKPNDELIIELPNFEPKNDNNGRKTNNEASK